MILAPSPAVAPTQLGQPFSQGQAARTSRAWKISLSISNTRSDRPTPPGWNRTGRWWGGRERVAHVVDHVDILRGASGTWARCGGGCGPGRPWRFDRLTLVIRFQPFGQRPPGGGGLHLQFWQGHGAPAEVFMGIEADLLEQRDDGADQHLAARARQASRWARGRTRPGDTKLVVNRRRCSSPTSTRRT